VFKNGTETICQFPKLKRQENLQYRAAIDHDCQAYNLCRVQQSFEMQVVQIKFAADQNCSWDMGKSVEFGRPGSHTYSNRRIHQQRNTEITDRYYSAE